MYIYLFEWWFLQKISAALVQYKTVWSCHVSRSLWVQIPVLLYPWEKLLTFNCLAFFPFVLLGLDIGMLVSWFGWKMSAKRASILPNTKHPVWQMPLNERFCLLFSVNNGVLFTAHKCHGLGLKLTHSVPFNLNFTSLKWTSVWISLLCSSQVEVITPLSFTKHYTYTHSQETPSLQGYTP